MKRFKRQVVFGTFSLVFLLSMLILPMQLGENMVFLQTRKTIAVIQTSSDRATAVAIDEMDLSQFEHPIKYIQVKSIAQLQAIAETSFYLITIYVGHGNPEGLQVGANLVPWTHLNSWTEKADLTFHIFAACHSIAALSPDSSRSFGFPGPIDAHIVGLVSRMVIAALFNMKDLVQALLVQLFSDSFLTLLLHPLLPLAWGPWTPWYTDWTLNGIITGVVWAGIAFGLAYVIGELIVILGAFGIVADLLGWLSGFWFQLMIAEFIGEVFCIICFQWRLRYDPQMELFQEQYRFALYNSLTHVYFWFGQPLSYVHG